MQFRLYGKVISRSVRKVKKSNGETYDLYQMVIEEPGQYPSRFQVGSKLASLFGPADGIFGVGKFVTATGFINGTERQAKRADGSSFTAYSTYLTLKTLDSAAPAQESQTSGDGEEYSDDIPF